MLVLSILRFLSICAYGYSNNWLYRGDLYESLLSSSSIKGVKVKEYRGIIFVNVFRFYIRRIYVVNLCTIALGYAYDPGKYNHIVTSGYHFCIETQAHYSKNTEKVTYND